MEQPRSQDQESARHTPDQGLIDDLRREIIRFTQAIFDAQGASHGAMTDAMRGATEYWEMRQDMEKDEAMDSES